MIRRLPILLILGAVYFAAPFTTSFAASAQISVADSLKKVIVSRGSDPVEGIWEVGGDGAKIAITAKMPGSGSFDVTLLLSPVLDAPEGELIGTATSTGKPGIYEFRLFNGKKSALLTKKKSAAFIGELDKPGQLSFRAFSKGKRLNLYRLVPYLFRIGIITEDSRPSDIDGAVKVFPASERPPKRMVF